MNEDAVEGRCEDCHREFYVTDEPKRCPHSGGSDVRTGQAVVMRPLY